MPDISAKQIDDLLPQTQCTQCGFAGCLPYATALAQGETQINRCPPGGENTIRALSTLLGKPFEVLNPECGTTVARHIANIDPVHCIGCTLCIAACPVDAIVGANKRRHAVVAELCTGCELCIAPCPVDCIDMVLVPDQAHWTQNMAHAARTRMQHKNMRLVRQTQEQTLRLEAQGFQTLDTAKPTYTMPEKNTKEGLLNAAIERARARRKQQNHE